jgi:hypothetical protein
MTDEQSTPVEPQQAAENPKPGQQQPGDSPKPAEPVEGDLSPPKPAMPS